MLYKWLLDNGFSPQRQVKFTWCKNYETGRFLPFDFCIDNIIIELDGLQHFEQVSNWQSPELSRIKDTYKERTAISKGYYVIRLLQSEVWNTLKRVSDNTNRKVRWQTILLYMLQRFKRPISILNSKKPIDKGRIILISNNASWPKLEGYYVTLVTYITELVFKSAS